MTGAGNGCGTVRGSWSTAIDRLCQPFSSADRPGIVVGVLLNGDPVHCAAYGSACLEHRLPMEVDTVLPIGSVSKHMCAAAVLRLQDNGALHLQQDIRNHVPEVPDFGVPITLRHLLTMTSGLPDGLVLPLFAGGGAADRMSRAAHLRLLERLSRPVFRPGDGMLYSNSNYMLLSLVIERVSGQGFADFMRDELFSPLGMNATRVVPWMHETVAGRARGYAPQAGSGDFVLQMAGDELCGDGGVHSTISDMLIWLLEYRAKRASEGWLEVESRLNDGQLMRYRLGIEVENRHGIHKVSHGGGLPGYLADFAYFPGHDLGIVAMANAIVPGVFALADDILEVIQPGNDTGRPVSLMPKWPEGVFLSIEPAYVFELRHEDDEAVCYMMGERAALRPAAGELMVSQRRGTYFELRRTSSAVEEKIELRVGAGPWLECQRMEFSALRVARELERYTGRYHSTELGETHHVRMDAKGRLRVSLESGLRSLRWERLVHLIDDIFVAPVKNEPSITNVIVRFVRDDDDAVAGFEYHINRARGVSFILDRYEQEGQANG